jgi:hypothetical protein
VTTYSSLLCFLKILANKPLSGTLGWFSRDLILYSSNAMIAKYVKKFKYGVCCGAAPHCQQLNMGDRQFPGGFEMSANIQNAKDKSHTSTNIDINQATDTEKILCSHCQRTATNGIKCKGICVADSDY